MDTNILLEELAVTIRRRCCEDSTAACRRCTFRRGCVVPVMEQSYRKIKELQEQIDALEAGIEQQ